MICAITADVTARIGDSPLLAGSAIGEGSACRPCARIRFLCSLLLGDKQVQLIREIVPRVAKLAGRRLCRQDIERRQIRRPPVREAARFESLINLKTAKAIGRRISQSLLLRADDVIQ